MRQDSGFFLRDGEVKRDVNVAASGEPLADRGKLFLRVPDCQLFQCQIALHDADYGLRFVDVAELPFVVFLLLRCACGSSLLALMSRGGAQWTSKAKSEERQTAYLRAVGSKLVVPLQELFLLRGREHGGGHLEGVLEQGEDDALFELRCHRVVDL